MLPGQAYLACISPGRDRMVNQVVRRATMYLAHPESSICLSRLLLLDIYYEHVNTLCDLVTLECTVLQHSRQLMHWSSQLFALLLQQSLKCSSSSLLAHQCSHLT